MRTSPLELDRIDSGIDFSRTAKFFARAGGAAYFGPVYFEQGSQPHMTIAVAEQAPEAASSWPRST